MVVPVLEAGRNITGEILLFHLWLAGPSLLSAFGLDINPLCIELRLKDREMKD